MLLNTIIIESKKVNERHVRISRRHLGFYVGNQKV
jgi:hypothetical protein